MKYKCEICNKKIRELMIQVFTCKCKGIYCSTHKHAHNCTYNFNADKPPLIGTADIKIDKI
jgi:hypothetical protein